MDPAGNESDVGDAISVTIDTTAPSAPGAPDLQAASDTGSSSTDNVTNDATPTFTVTSCENGSLVTLSGASLTASGSCAFGTVSVTLGAVPADGAYAFTAYQTDPAGNTSTPSAAMSVTVDTTAPSLSSLAPVDNATGVATTADLVLTFDANVTAVTGESLTLKTGADDSTVESVWADGSRVSVSANVVTVDPTDDLDASTAYYVLVDAGAFVDAAGNGFDGVAASTTWNFTTEGSSSSSSSLSSASAVASSSEMTGNTPSGARRGAGANMRQAGTRRGSVSESSSSAPRTRSQDVQPRTTAHKRGRLLLRVGQNAILFRDVRMDAWYARYVRTLVEAGIANGYRTAGGAPTGEFGVASPATLAEVLKMAVESLGTAVDLSTLRSPRNESAHGTWAAPYLAFAENRQLALFSSERDVHQPATRGETVRVILEVLGVTIGGATDRFVDLPANHPHADAIATAARFGLLSGDADAAGTPAATIRPDAFINRAETAKLIALALRISGAPPR